MEKAGVQESSQKQSLLCIVPVQQTWGAGLRAKDLGGCRELNVQGNIDPRNWDVDVFKRAEDRDFNGQAAVRCESSGILFWARLQGSRREAEGALRERPDRREQHSDLFSDPCFLVRILCLFVLKIE
jgi:hypothetical protein